MPDEDQRIEEHARMGLQLRIIGAAIMACNAVYVGLAWMMQRTGSHSDSDQWRSLQ
jgi:hypothetical protein